MSKKVLVMGDSYAKNDKKEGHWANIWCQRKKYDIVHDGIGGGNHVTIVNKFLQKEINNNYDLIIYCMTNWLRASVPARTNPDFISTISQFIQDSKDITFEDLLSTNFEKGWEQLVLVNGISEEEKATELYKHISINFLARANLFAVETLILNCKFANIPLILATTPDDHTTLDNLKKYNVNIFKVDTGDPKEIDLDKGARSLNHLSNTMHNFVKEKFNIQYGNII